jgi:putative DNA-invertase from lambdoid prophage Rac
VKAAIWARVSTEEQDTGNQLAELRGWADRRGLDIITEYVLDGASAWTGGQREQLGQALDDARLGRYDVLLVWALDRLSREGVEATLALLRRFREHGVVVCSLRESWTETSDSRMAELLGSLFAWMAAEESRRRSERVRAGVERRRAAGLPVGRQPGAADRKPRKRSGYVARWERERAASGRVASQQVQELQA